jgi:hypothetical protein
MKNIPTKLSRRHLLSLAAGALLKGAAAASLFEEIPPSVSGITWVHENAQSEARYLPEALGPGCAISRLRQRRMDGHLSR